MKKPSEVAMYSETEALMWYRKNIGQYPQEDGIIITSEIKEYELMRDSFLLGAHYASQKECNGKVKS